jgi:hypothetical protein
MVLRLHLNTVRTCKHMLKTMASMLILNRLIEMFASIEEREVHKET